MKKSNLMLPAALLLMSAISLNGQSQVAMNTPRGGATGEEDLFLKSESVSAASVNQKALKNFRKEYRLTSSEEWSVLSDQSLMCRFVMDNIHRRAFYTAHGQWTYTVSSYSAAKLDKRIHDQVKSVYYNSDIVFVNQIDRVDGKPIYIVEIQDEKSIRKIRVEDDEMEIIEELDKQ